MNIGHQCWKWELLNHRSGHICFLFFVSVFSVILVSLSLHETYLSICWLIATHNIRIDLSIIGLTLCYNYFYQWFIYKLEPKCLWKFRRCSFHYLSQCRISARFCTPLRQYLIGILMKTTGNLQVYPFHGSKALIRPPLWCQHINF